MNTKKMELYVIPDPDCVRTDVKITGCCPIVQVYWSLSRWYQYIWQQKWMLLKKKSYIHVYKSKLSSKENIKIQNCFETWN